MLGRSLVIAAGLAACVSALTVSAQGAAAATVCHAQGGQYADTRTCVTSVLPSQGRNNYGPQQITGSEEGAWCEGVAGPGVGEAVTIYQDPPMVIGSLTFKNGYAKSDQTFRANGRIKRARIDTSGGYSKEITLQDSALGELIKLPPSRIAWVKLTILQVYPGSRHSDTCISQFYFNHDEFGGIEEPN
jgi:hypothetical protein